MFNPASERENCFTLILYEFPWSSKKLTSHLRINHLKVCCLLLVVIVSITQPSFFTTTRGLGFKRSILSYGHRFGALLAHLTSFRPSSKQQSLPEKLPVRFVGTFCRGYGQFKREGRSFMISGVWRHLRNHCSSSLLHISIAMRRLTLKWSQHYAHATVQSVELREIINLISLVLWSGHFYRQQSTGFQTKQILSRHAVEIVITCYAIIAHSHKVRVSLSVIERSFILPVRSPSINAMTIDVNIREGISQPAQ